MKIKTSEKQRVFICGDLHGEYEFFMRCLQDLGFNTEIDVLVCTGDLVDRGPESYKLLCHFQY
jgi:serine/threonine protein phosphatase 1